MVFVQICTSVFFTAAIHFVLGWCWDDLASGLTNGAGKNHALVNTAASIIKPANNSLWEQLKIIWYPGIVVALLFHFQCNPHGDLFELLAAFAVGLTVGIVFDIVAHLIVDALFVDSVQNHFLDHLIHLCTSYVVVTEVFRTVMGGKAPCWIVVDISVYGHILLPLWFVLFFFFTQNPPDLPIFKNRV